MEVKKKSVLPIVFLVICFILIITLVLYMFFCNDFKIKNFDYEIEIDYNSSFDDSKINVCYGNNFKCSSANYEIISNNVDTEKLGTYDVEYRVYKGKKEKIIKQKVTVADREAPVLKVDYDVIKVCPNDKTDVLDKSAIDNYDGDISDKITYRKEDGYFVFEVIDSSGNKAEVKVKSLYEDSVKPVLTLSGKTEMDVYQYVTFSEPGYKAIDDCDGDITKNVIVSGSVDTQKIGRYFLTYSVKDSSGNETVLKRIVNVVQKAPLDSSVEHVIYLTFDDGPSAYTNKLLDVLKKYDVKATFFVTNYGIAAGYGNCIKRAFDEGHTIALHSDTHDYKKIYSSEDAYFNDLYTIQKKVKNITGQDAYLMRFPGGSSNMVSSFNPGIMSRLVVDVQEKGFYYFDWNVSSGDAGEVYTTNAVVSNVIKALGNGKSYVVLQHDTKGFSVDAVETIIQYGLSRGYKFKALTSDSPKTHHKVAN